MRELLKRTLNVINSLDFDRISLVYYHPKTMELIISQLGGIHVRLNNLVGFIDPIKHTCILYPEDLRHIKDAINFILESNSTILMAPIKSGFKIWKSGDVIYTSKPKRLTDIKFYSISNKLLINYVKVTNEEVNMLFNTKLEF